MEDYYKFLDENYIPEYLPFRESQIEIIKKKIEKYKLGLNPTYLLIYGSTGLGKTATVKYVFENFILQKIKYVYINAFLNNSLNSIISQILEELKISLVTRGLSTEELISSLINYLKNSNIKLVLCVDEVDKLKDINEFLYLFLRLNSLFNYSVYLILISNNKDFLLGLDKRVLSSLVFEEIEFKPYTFEQLKIITKERIRPILGNNYDEASIMLIANMAYKNNSDVRIILKILRKILEVLIEKKEDKLTIELTKSIISKFESKNQKKEYEIQDIRQKEIINLLKEGEKTTTELFEILSKKFQIKKRTFNYIIKDLTRKDLIEIKRIGGIKGSRFIAKLKI